MLRLGTGLGYGAWWVRYGKVQGTGRNVWGIFGALSLVLKGPGASFWGLVRGVLLAGVR